MEIAGPSNRLRHWNVELARFGRSARLGRDGEAQLSGQTLGQAKGYAITILCAALPDEEGDPAIDDAYERFDRPGRR